MRGPVSASVSPVSYTHLHVTLVTAYDYPTGRLLTEAGVDIVLVGDSVGMVLLGFPDTTHVTLDHMIHHVEATARGVAVSYTPLDVYKRQD